MKIWLIFGAIVIGGLFARNYINQRESEQAKAACLIDTNCQNLVAKFKSERVDHPVQSSTGTLFFKGNECTDDCSGHIEGYEWAKELGVSKEDSCDSNSTSFNQGCLRYVSERIDELRQDFIDENVDEETNDCMPGKYGDC